MLKIKVLKSEMNVKDYWKTLAYYTIIDEVVNNMKTRLFPESLQLAMATDYFFNLHYEKDYCLFNNKT